MRPARPPAENVDERRPYRTPGYYWTNRPGPTGAGSTTPVEIGDFLWNWSSNHPEYPRISALACGKPLLRSSKRAAPGTGFCEEHVPAPNPRATARPDRAHIFPGHPVPPSHVSPALHLAWV